VKEVGALPSLPTKAFMPCSGTALFLKFNTLIKVYCLKIVFFFYFI
jgi:hypothetical protein